MKKISFYAVLAAATLASVSCSNDDVLVQSPNVNKPIEFGAYTGRSAAMAPTRAHSINDAIQLDTDGGFGVFAYYTNDVNYSSTATPNFMYNEQVDKVDGNWAYDPLKYWPNEEADNVTFFAYAPYAAADVVDNFEFTSKTNAGDPIITFTVNGDVQAQKDLLYGVNATSGLPYLNMDKMNVSDRLSFHFRHALSRIGFNVQAMIDYVNDDQTGTADDAADSSKDIDTNTTISVQKVELIGKFYADGQLNLNNTKAHTPNWTGLAADPTERTFTLDDNDFEDIHEAVTTTKTQLNTKDAWVMVIPQDLNADMINIRVTYTVTTTDSNLAEPIAVKNVIESGEFAFKFEHGMSYMFNLHLGLTSVKFNATVEGWHDAQNETAVNVPINQ